MTWQLGCPRLPPAVSSPAACTWSTDAEHYRKLQEVSYLNEGGASVWSVLSLMCTYPLILAVQQVVAQAAAKYFPSPTLRATVEYITAMLPMTCTFSAPHLVWMSILTMVVMGAAVTALITPTLAWPRAVSLCLASRAARKQDGSFECFSYFDVGRKRLRFITEYRAVVMITTCIAILAVDFPSIFSRDHAKTETFGYSLMDLGTGCTICASALCSPHARGLRQGRRLSAIARRVLSLWPILAIGIVRFAVLWGIDYHVPTSEYGVHWNFFFTITLVALAATAVDFGPVASGVAGAALLFTYQFGLSYAGGAEYMLTAERQGFFSANREGILGCFGFMALHWLAVAMGGCIHSGRLPPSRLANALLFAACVLCALSEALASSGLPVSRRLCNLPYVTFTLGVNALVLGSLAFLDLRWPVPRAPLVPAYAGVSESMFATFMVANLCTGLVNMTMQPLLVPSGSALLIMVLYSLCWMVPFGVLHSKGIAVKLW